ncbi:type II secretion system F family protein [Gammaproteobacteria bacterium]|jgi:tight adherence protein B|nr:type II secretion system F family protein [Gammaproteobacteria bacterium]
MELILLSIFALTAFSILAFALLSVANGARHSLEADMQIEADMNLKEMFLFVDSGKLIRIYMVALVIVPLLVFMVSFDIVATLIAAALMALVPRIFYKRAQAARLAAFESLLPDAFMAISSSLQAGSSLMGALENLVEDQPAPLNQEFALLVRQVKLGINFDEALISMENRLPSQDFRVALSAIRISREVGGNLSEVIESLAATLRQKAAMEGKIAALTSQGVMQGYVMTGLPILLGVVLFYMEPEAMSKIHSTPMGYGFLFTITVMLVLGFLIIRSITRIDV